MSTPSDQMVMSNDVFRYMIQCNALYNIIEFTCIIVDLIVLEYRLLSCSA